MSAPLSQTASPVAMNATPLLEAAPPVSDGLLQAFETWGHPETLRESAVDGGYFLAQAEAEHGEAEHDTHATDTQAEAAAHADDTHASDAHAEAAGDAERGADAHAADAGHGADAAHQSKGYRMPEEFPNIYTLFTAATAKDDGHGAGHGEEGGHHAPFWVNPLFAAVHGFVFLYIVCRIIKKRSVANPSKAQVGIEMLFMGLMNFFGDVVGKENARKYVPYVASLWLFILVNKLTGLVPGLKSPMAHFPSVAALGLVTFLWVNANGIAAGGIKHFVWHLCGSPTGVVGWGLVPLMLPLEIVGTLIKPVSLSLRLWGNTLGEDKLLASFLGLGMIIVSLMFNTDTPITGIPLHFPFMFLGILGSLIQSTVFAVLAAVYISLLLPHDDHGHGEHEEANA